MFRVLLLLLLLPLSLLQRQKKASLSPQHHQYHSDTPRSTYMLLSDALLPFARCPQKILIIFGFALTLNSVTINSYLIIFLKLSTNNKTNCAIPCLSISFTFLSPREFGLVSRTVRVGFVFWRRDYISPTNVSRSTVTLYSFIHHRRCDILACDSGNK